MTLIDSLRITSMICWLAIGLYRANAFARIYWGSVRYYDEFGAMLSAIGFLFFGFSLRWYLPDSEAIFAGLYLFSTVLALMVFRVLRRYEGAAV